MLNSPSSSIFLKPKKKGFKLGFLILGIYLFIYLLIICIAIFSHGKKIYKCIRTSVLFSGEFFGILGKLLEFLVFLVHIRLILQIFNKKRIA